MATETQVIVGPMGTHIPNNLVAVKASAVPIAGVYTHNPTSGTWWQRLPTEHRDSFDCLCVYGGGHAFYTLKSSVCYIIPAVNVWGDETPTPTSEEGQ